MVIQVSVLCGLSYVISANQFRKIQFTYLFLINRWLLYVAGRQASYCDLATWYYGLGMAFLAVAAPSLPCLFGITALFMR